MVRIIKQREYIENFLEFVRSFMITESATINEINLVEANLDILKERIQRTRDKVVIKGWLEEDKK